MFLLPKEKPGKISHQPQKWITSQLSWSDRGTKHYNSELAVSGPVITCYEALVKPKEKLRQQQISRISGKNTFALLLEMKDH